MYASYDYYIQEYVLGGSAIIPADDYERYAKLADLELDRVTHNRTTLCDPVPDKVKDCACAVAELLYKADQQDQAYIAQGLAGPVESWSNDGQSGKVDLGQSVYTVSGKQKEIYRLCSLYIGPLGLMYAGVVHFES